MATRKPMAPAAAAKAAADPSQERGGEQGAMPAIPAPAGKLTASQLAYGEQDPLAEQGEEQSLRLQMYQDRRSKAMTTMSNVMQKSSDNADNITDNMK